MRKYLGYIPAIFLPVFYLFIELTGAFIGLPGASMMLSIILIWLPCFLLAAVLLHKGIIWGGVFGVLPVLHMIYRGEILVGIAVLLFYLILSIYLWKKKDTDAPATSNKEVLVVFVKIALTAFVVAISVFVAYIGSIPAGVHQVLVRIGIVLLPSFLLPLIWLKKREKFLRIWRIPAAIYFVFWCVNECVKDFL